MSSRSWLWRGPLASLAVPKPVLPYLNSAHGFGEGVTIQELLQKQSAVLVSLRGSGNDHGVPGAGFSWLGAKHPSQPRRTKSA